MMYEKSCPCNMTFTRKPRNTSKSRSRQLQGPRRPPSAMWPRERSRSRDDMLAIENRPSGSSSAHRSSTPRVAAAPRYTDRGVWGLQPDSDAEYANEQLRTAVAEIISYGSAYVKRHSDDTATLYFTHRVVESLFASQQPAQASGGAEERAPHPHGAVDDPWAWHPKNRVLSNNGNRNTRREFNYCWYQRADNVDAKANHFQVLLNWNKTKLNWQSLDLQLQQTVERQWTAKKHLNWVIPVAMKKKFYYYNIIIICDEAPDSAESQQLRQTIKALEEQYEWILSPVYGRYGRIVGVQVSEDTGMVRPIMYGESPYCEYQHVIDTALPRVDRFIIKKK